MRHPLNVEKRLEIRKNENSFRELKTSTDIIDFSSNDYLGFSRNSDIYKRALALLQENGLSGRNGATGSRLLTGNHQIYTKTEDYIRDFHQSEAALIFNSGFDANIGIFSCVPQRGDIILFDELVHASIREGIRLSNARAFKFEHNNLPGLENLLVKYSSKATGTQEQNIYIVTESVFSMDGDKAPLKEIADLAENYKAFLIVDEAHATGVFGKKGQGLVQQLDLQNKVFARIITFGKAMGAHGAAVTGSKLLVDYLINFSRSFIYTTALPPHAVATILASYMLLNDDDQPDDILLLNNNIKLFSSELALNDITSEFIRSDSTIQCVVIPGNETVKKVAIQLQEAGFDVRAILSPTVKPGKERIRICLHSFNTTHEIKALVKQLAILIK